MDIEVGKDDLSVDDGKLVVFNDIGFTCKEFKNDIVIKAESLEDLREMLQSPSVSSRRVGLRMNLDKTKVMYNSYVNPMPISVDNVSIEVVQEYTYQGQIFQLENWWNRRQDPGGQEILSGASGAIRPGRLTFILGPSGAGKTTLLKILAARKRLGVTGSLLGAGRSAVFVAQHATLIDSLTAGETLKFAASLKLPQMSRRERCCVIKAVCKQLGIEEVLHRKAGLLSGGERKRLTIACELITDPAIMLLDEPTSGLDSVSSLSVARALQIVARGGRTVACVIHQPSSKLFAMADDVILLANGRTLYSGAVADLPATLQKADFECPQYYNMADYLLEVATGEHKGNFAVLETEVKSYAYEMKKIAKIECSDKNGKEIITNEAEALLSNAPPEVKGYPSSYCHQLVWLLWRGVIGAIRDVHVTQIRLVAHLVVALLLGALFADAGSTADRMITNTSCLFFFLLFLFFSNAMPTIHNFPVESTVVLQEHLNKWYSIFTYCVSKIVVDLPIQLLCATVFLLPAWYMTSQPGDGFRIALAWTVCVLLTILAQTFGLVVGAACGVKLGLFVIPAANIPMLMFSEFFIPYREIPTYLRPFALISYFKYSFDALLQTTYGFERPKLSCVGIFCMFRKPEDLLNHLGVPQNYMNDIWALLIWIALLQISLVLVLILRVHKTCK